MRTAAMIIACSKTAFSGRLSFVVKDGKCEGITYCAGQYFPTEYRRAACAVMAAVIWEHYRATLKPEPAQSMGDALRSKMRELFG